VTESGLSHDAVTALPGTAAAAVVWQRRGRLQVTVVVKATFAFAQEAPMPWVEPEAIVAGEVHYGKNPARSTRFTTDLAPHLARADVLFTGNAHALPGSTVLSMTARLAVLRDDRALVDKRLLVRDPVGFEKMPIVYERAYGGVEWPDNPLGVGASPGTDEPNILDPANPERTAGFGPIGRAWPARRWLLGAVSRKALEGPRAVIPDDFDWTYFQAAPADQRVEYLRGDEWIVLEGMHPTEPRLRMRLPGVTGHARIDGLGSDGARQEIDLLADTLRIDGDKQRCTVVWRRSFPVANEAELAAVRVVAGVRVAGQTLAWPERGAAATAVPRPLPRAPVDGTAELHDDELEFVDEEPDAVTIAVAPHARSSSDDRVTLPPPEPGALPMAVLPFQPAGGAIAPRRERRRDPRRRRR
jgi:hypothetical protein